MKPEVEKLISENNVVVFSKSYCPYCTKAKGLLSQLGVEFQAIELDRVSNGSAIQSTLLSMTGQRTVPNIFIKQQHLGGCDDLHAAHSNGSLAEKLK